MIPLSKKAAIPDLQFPEGFIIDALSASVIDRRDPQNSKQFGENFTDAFHYADSINSPEGDVLLEIKTEGSTTDVIKYQDLSETGKIWSRLEPDDPLIPEIYKQTDFFGFFQYELRDGRQARLAEKPYFDISYKTYIKDPKKRIIEES